jgi:signal transduction histidine kinase
MMIVGLAEDWHGARARLARRAHRAAGTDEAHAAQFRARDLWSRWGRRGLSAQALAGPHGDAVVAGLLGLLAVAESIMRAAISAPAGARAANVGLNALLLCVPALATTVPLVFQRPEATAVAVAAASLLSLTLFHTLTVAGLAAAVIAAFRLGRRGSQLLAGVLTVPFVVLALIGSPGSEPGVLTVLLASMWPAAAWAGSARRARAEAREHNATQAVVAGTLLEHTARGERARISRELHDVVAHHISMIAVQAESARLTTPGMPAAGAQRLLAIGDTARAALTEMRRLLGVLREDARTGPAERQPQPGLQQLNELLDEARDASGTAARLIVSGPLTALDPGVELATYRIVQEALTNVRRHAPGAAVDVELRYGADALQLRVRDNGPGPPGDARPGGHGLLGMRERAAAVGGELGTGPAPGGGFVVEAILPAQAGGA